MALPPNRFFSLSSPLCIFSTFVISISSEPVEPGLILRIVSIVHRFARFLNHSWYPHRCFHITRFLFIVDCHELLVLFPPRSLVFLAHRMSGAFDITIFLSFVVFLIQIHPFPSHFLPAASTVYFFQAPQSFKVAPVTSQFFRLGYHALKLPDVLFSSQRALGAFLACDIRSLPLLVGEACERPLWTEIDLL